MLSPLARSTAGLVSFLLLRPTTHYSALAFGTASSSTSSKMTKQTLEGDGVIPDVLPNFTPTVSIRVSYDRHHITMGEQLLPVQAVHVPMVRLEGSEAGTLYTLVMSDPDAPSPSNPTHREWLHWIVADIPGGVDSIANGHQVGRRSSLVLWAARTSLEPF